MKWMGSLFVLVMSFALAACNQETLIAKFTPHPESEMAKQAIDDWRGGRIEALRALLAPAVQDGVTDEQFTTWAAEFPKGEPRSVKVVGAVTHIQNGEHRYDLTYEYEFQGEWLVATAVILKKGSEAKVIGIHGQVFKHSLEQINAFTLRNKGALHLLMLALAVASPLFCIVTCIVCIRTPMRRRKVLWALFTLVGAVTVHFNWTTGQASFSPLSFQLLGSSVFSAPYGPWVLGFSLPIGAIIFLLRRKALIEREPTRPDASVLR